MFIQGYMIRQLIMDGEKRRREQSMAMLWLAAYTFLLRVPSEAVPMAKGDAVASEWPGNEQSVLFLQDENTLCLKLLRRKHMMRGTVIKRTCSCKNSVRLCPIHVLSTVFPLVSISAPSLGHAFHLAVGDSLSPTGHCGRH
jgi:hypothetical protein